MSIHLAIPVHFDLTADADAFEEDVPMSDDYLDSPIDELGEAVAIQDLYSRGVAREPEE